MPQVRMARTYHGEARVASDVPCEWVPGLHHLEAMTEPPCLYCQTRRHEECAELLCPCADLDHSVDPQTLVDLAYKGANAQ